MIRAALIIIAVFFVTFQGKAQVFEEYLLSGWTMQASSSSAIQADAPTVLPASSSKTLPAEVPGSVQYNLMLNGKRVADSIRQQWTYSTTFEADQYILSRAFVNLLFQGLDSRANVYLNEQLILQADNMFRSWSVPVKPLLQEGDNTLRIDFIQTAADSLAVRKARYHFDRSLAEVPLGIWKPVILQSFDTFHFKDFTLLQDSLRGRNAHLRALVEVRGKAGTALSVEVYDEISGKRYARQEVALRDSVQVWSVPFQLRGVDLWWPKGMGKQSLYQIGVRVSSGKSDEQKRVKRTGIRELAREGAQLKVNGQQVEVRAGEYVPGPLEVSARRSAEYDQLFDSLDAQGINLIRLSAKGIYESDYFYDLADGRGILIMHDLMFARGLAYPANEAFIENAAAEVRQEFRRLNHHPSLVGWSEAGLKGSAPRLLELVREAAEKNKATLISQDGF